MNFALFCCLWFLTALQNKLLQQQMSFFIFLTVYLAHVNWCSFSFSYYIEDIIIIISVTLLFFFII